MGIQWYISAHGGISTDTSFQTELKVKISKTSLLFSLPVMEKLENRPILIGYDDEYKTIVIKADDLKGKKLRLQKNGNGHMSVGDALAKWFMSKGYLVDGKSQAYHVTYNTDGHYFETPRPQATSIRWSSPTI